MLDHKQIRKRFEKAKTERGELEGYFDDAIRLTMPARRRFTTSRAGERGEDIFDETGANAVQEFASRMQAGITPPFTEFCRLEAGASVAPADRKAVNRDLDVVNEIIFEEIWASNFAQESAECYLDLAISTGCLNVEAAADGRLVHRAIPITEAYYERGADDGIGGVYREAKVKASQIEARYPRAEIKKGSAVERIIANEPDRELDMLEYTVRLDKKQATEHYVLACDVGEVISYRKLEGRGSAPMIPFRWSSAAGETWGRGPVLNALGAIRTTNLMVELVLENAAMAIVGIYQSDNEATVNADNLSLVPGTILAREIGTNGLEPVNMAAGNFNMQDVVLGDQRLNIRKALYNDMLSDPNKTPATATEVVERTADLAYRTSAGFSRVFFEFVQPYIWRVVRLLEQRGIIELPKMQSGRVAIRATSPLAFAQRARDLQSLMQEFQIKLALFGQQGASATYNPEVLLQWLHERTGLHDGIYASYPEFQKAMQNTMDMAAALQAQGNMGGQ